MQSILYENNSDDVTTAMLNRHDNEEAVENPYTVFVQQDGKRVNWIAYTMGKVNNIVWGSMSEGIVQPEYGCKRTNLKLINDMIRELKNNDYIIAGTIARNRAAALIQYHLNGRKTHESCLLEEYIESTMRELGVMHETVAVIERAYEKWFFATNPEDRNLAYENIRGVGPLLNYIKKTHIDSQKFPGDCPSIDTCQKNWDKVCGLYGERSLR
jgi:hypothetical protein